MKPSYKLLEAPLILLQKQVELATTDHANGQEKGTLMPGK
jgi:hypothetical protein